ncbi:hypothetical protein [Shewanella putrefaciens]|uniref:hypothetical protein n=1 Tax=Shewanella putrefaciens TaxID=24 RepID=UPI0018E82082|nr:hypothetical protein [Shewanella putrefaciens]
MWIQLALILTRKRNVKQRRSKKRRADLGTRSIAGNLGYVRLKKHQSGHFSGYFSLGSNTLKSAMDMASGRVSNAVGL